MIFRYPEILKIGPTDQRLAIRDSRCVFSGADLSVLSCYTGWITRKFSLSMLRGSKPLKIGKNCHFSRSWNPKNPPNSPKIDKNPGFGAFFVNLNVIAITWNIQNTQKPHFSDFGHFELIWARNSHFGPLCGAQRVYFQVWWKSLILTPKNDIFEHFLGVWD